MQCTLAMLECAGKQKYSFYHFISGTDFPIKSQDYLHNFFDSHPQEQFIGFDWAGIESGKFLDRMKYYHFFINILGKRGGTSFHKQILASIADISLAFQRKMRVNRIKCKMFKGSSWFSITHSAVCAIVSKKNEILKRYRFTANSDELWLQTFAMEHFPEQIALSNLRYIKWIQGNPSPETLTMRDYDDLLHTEMVFARKFDWNKDKNIIFKLKSHILGK